MLNFKDEAWRPSSDLPTVELKLDQMKNELNSWAKQDNSVGRFMGGYINEKAYSNLGVHGFNFWSLSSKCKLSYTKSCESAEMMRCAEQENGSSWVTSDFLTFAAGRGILESVN